MDIDQFFRAGVGVAIVDGDGAVLAFQRNAPDGRWQLPQGGIEPGESPKDSARRELKEETGLDWEQVELLAQHPAWLAYELPPADWSEKTGRGQVQQWFIVRLVDDAPAVRTDRVDPQTGDPEFVGHRWMGFEELVAGAVEFRRRVYRELGDFVRSLPRAPGPE